jgi:hypothetical protein
MNIVVGRNKFSRPGTVGPNLGRTMRDRGQTTTTKPQASASLRRRTFEIVFWVVMIGALWSLDLLTKFDYRARNALLDEATKTVLIAEQITSGIAALMMVWFVVIWVRQFPIVEGQLLRSALGHVVGSVLFAFGHFALMIGSRIALFPILIGRNYVWWGDPVGNLVFEYQKDVKIYAGMVTCVAVYHFWRKQNADDSESLPRRLFVQTGRGSQLLEFDDIECLTAARNYVSVLTAEREYVVRETLANLYKRLPEDQFARSHRSHIVNLGRITELRGPASGPQSIRLQSGREVPVGRSFSKNFTESMSKLYS